MVRNFEDLFCGGVAQLVRAFGSYPKGRRFDPVPRYLLAVYLYKKTFTPIHQSAFFIWPCPLAFAKLFILTNKGGPDL